MKLIGKQIVVALLITLFSNYAVAQNNKDTALINKDKDSSYVSASLSYMSDAVFMGRKDSISAPYLYPSLTYYHKSGFYANGSFSYLTKSNESRIDLFLITAGFDFDIKKFNGDISVSKYFFNSDSYNVISEVLFDISATIRYDFDVVNLSIAASNYFSNDNNSDVFLSSEISHDFVTHNNKFQISPTIGAHFGSQNFYQQYFINKQFGNGQGQGQTAQPENNIVIQQSEKFNLMAIEFSVPIWYVQKPFSFLFLPAYVLPQNEATFILDDTLLKENLDKTFYWMFGVSYTF